MSINFSHFPQNLIEEGTFEEVMYIIAMGVVEVTVKGKFIKHLTVGDHFGEMSILTKQPRSVFALHCPVSALL